MLVKACGLRNLEEIRWAHDLGYDFWGIVLDPCSKRYVRPEELKALWRRLAQSEGWQNRSVLVAREWQSLEPHARFCTKALLQCYNGFPDSIAPERRILPIGGEEQLCLAQRSAAYFLYDVSLGSGQWQGLPDWCCDKERLLVAGGLGSERLRELAAEWPKRSFGGFDLSSGLEDANDGNGRSRKDYHKMKECVELIRSDFEGSGRLI